MLVGGVGGTPSGVESWCMPLEGFPVQVGEIRLLLTLWACFLGKKKVQTGCAAHVTCIFVA